MSESLQASQPARLIYGTAWKKERTTEWVNLALETGFRAIDTACQPKHYDEAGVGDAIARFTQTGGQRADLFVQTKFSPVGGQDRERIPYDPEAPLADQVQQSFTASLRNLRTDYLNSLLLHAPLPQFEDTLAAWRAMEALVDAGGVRQIGVSNCYDLQDFEELLGAARIRPAVLQNRFYQQTHYDRELRRRCLELQIEYQSFWTLTANPDLLQHEILVGVAQRHDRSPAQALFRFLTQEGVSPLTGTTSAEHMRQDLAIFEFALDDAEREALRSLL